MIIPLVSVIIPSYNYAEYIGEAIESVLNQTFNNFELIVVDNFSTDETKKILESFQDSRMRIIEFENSGVIGASRNVGFMEAAGKFIAFLDADDRWSYNKLELSLCEIQKGSDFVYHAMNLIDETSKKLPKQYIGRKLKSPIYLDLIMNGSPIINSSVLVNSSALKKIGGFSEDPNFVGFEDFDAWIRLARNGIGFKYVGAFLGDYRVHSRNHTQRQEVLIPHAALATIRSSLSNKQLSRFESNYTYQQLRYNFKFQRESISAKDVLFLLFHSRLEFKLKSLYMGLVIFFKKGSKLFVGQQQPMSLGR